MVWLGLCATCEPPDEVFEVGSVQEEPEERDGIWKKLARALQRWTYIQGPGAYLFRVCWLIG